MYKVIGADQKEYGPVSAEQINDWIAQGRANGSSRIRADGSEEWKPLRDFPEFADALATVTNAAMRAAPPANLQPSRTSRLAIWSLVLGLIGVITFGITSIVGLVLGIIALVKISKARGALGGLGFALAGTVVSGFCLLFAATLLPALSQAQTKAKTISCMNNTKQLCLGVMMYASDNANQLPANAWCDAIMTYVGTPQTFKCLEGDPNQRSHYAFNAKLQGLRTDQILSPATTVLLFETDGGWNLSGGPELLPRKPHHNKNVIVGFADGHVEMVTPARMQSLQWTPKLAGQ
jgi:prepilin-type processing-associated H-X9-DG protein